MIVARSPRPLRRSAFSLMEVMIVVAIIVVLAGIAGVYVFGYLEDAKRDRARADVETISKAIDSYMIRNQRNPPQSLQELTQPSETRPEPYLQGAESIIDPWGNPYQYDPQGSRNAQIGKTRPDVWTVDPANGQEIGNWTLANK